MMGLLLNQHGFSFAINALQRLNIETNVRNCFGV